MKPTVKLSESQILVIEMMLVEPRRLIRETSYTKSPWIMDVSVNHVRRVNRNTFDSLIKLNILICFNEEGYRKEYMLNPSLDIQPFKRNKHFFPDLN